MPIRLASLVDRGKQGCEVTGFFHSGSGRFCVTIATKARAKEVLRDIAGAREIYANGRLDKRTVTSDSGEVYRMIIGIVAAWRFDDEAGAR
jgi:hypothetical protein